MKLSSQFSRHLSQAFLEDYLQTDKIMLVLLLLHWLFASTVLAYSYGLYTLGFVAGGLIMSLVGIAYWFYRGTAIFRIIVGMAFMLFSAVFIQQHLGRIEMHFHIFIALAILMRYKDAHALIAGVVTTTIHHAFFSFCQENNWQFFNTSITVYNYGEGFSITLLHAVFVLLALTVNLYLIRSLRAQFITNIEYSEALALKNKEVEASKIALKEEKEKEAAANKAKSHFIANMSHELRTPLNAILGYSEILKEVAEEEDRQADIQDLNKIHISGSHLLNLINDILDISKIEAERMDISPDTFNVSQLLKEVIITAEPLVQKNHNQFKFKLDKNLGEMCTDSTKLRQILLNLLSNASKFCKQGAIHLEAKLITEKGDDWLYCQVCDEGIGISDAQLQKLFHAFIQADARISNKYGGTGLGLVISERFSRLMGGRIEVKSELNQGSCFTLYLPMRLSETELALLRHKMKSS